MSMSALSWHDERSPRELARWAIAGSIVLGVHAGALSYLLAVHEPDVVGSNMDVVTVELAPIDSTPDAVEQDLAPAPETMVEFEPASRFAEAARAAEGGSEARAAAG